jgi:hypothetical protein
MEGKPQNKKYRDKEGAVIIENANMRVNPVKHGKVGTNVTLGGIIPSVAAEYGIEKALAVKEREYHYTKI